MYSSFTINTQLDQSKYLGEERKVI